MVSLLIADMLRRVPVRAAAGLAVGLMLAWLMLGSEHHSSQAVALSLAVAFTLGPFCVPLLAHTPLTPYLPVSRRDGWRAIWLMMVPGPPVVTTVLTLPAVLLTGSPSWSGLTLSTVMACAYAGTGCALLAFGGLVSPGHVTRRGYRRWLELPVPLLYLGGPFWSYAFVSALPRQWADLTPLSVPVLLAGVGCAAAAYFYTPSFASRGRRRVRASPAARPTAGGRRAALSGLPRLFAHELAFATTMAVNIVSAIAAVSLIVGAYSGSLKTIGAFASRALLPFSPLPARQAVHDFDVFDQLFWYGMFAASVSPRFPEMLRHLRVLPVGAARLHAALLGWPVLFWTLVWLLLALVQGAVTGHGFVAYRPDLLVFFAGLTALAQALVLRFQSRWVRSACGVPILIPFGVLAYRGSPWLFAVAAVMVPAAIALNRDAFARSATYRRVPPGRARTESR